MEQVVGASGVSVSVSDKKSSSSSSNNNNTITAVSGSLILMKQQQLVYDGGSTTLLTTPGEPPHSSKMATSDNQENNLSRPFIGAAAGGRGVDPIEEGYSRGANEVVMPFDIFATASSYPASNTCYKSPGMGMDVSLFTHAQWKELERQAMIYKYMISSVPVPRHLLFPFSTDSSAAAAAASSAAVYGVKYPRNGSDPEPGRCKRTDGKKWRCSRDVAPHHKYCERHLHRGRPRSRKLVEPKSNNNNNNNNIGENHKKTRLQQTPTTLPKPNSSSQHPDAKDEAFNSFANAGTDFGIFSGSSQPFSYNRDLGLMMGSEHNIAMNINGIDMQRLESSNNGFSNLGFSMYGSNDSILYDHGYMEQQRQPLDDVYSHSNLTAPEIEAPIGFIDAWSSIGHNLNQCNNAKEPSLSPNDGNLSPSLTLSMAMSHGNNNNTTNDNGFDEESRWFNPISWEPFACGGPLAEALQPAGSVCLGCSNPTSPYDSTSTPVTTAASSPSGVLHRTLFMQSDNSSVCNSPTLTAAQPSEDGFRWLN